MAPDEHPKGTLFILLIFLLLSVAAWVGIYALMLSRGGVS
jgi:hypothetical protein